jgi:mannose-6-phosphate isomerase-like protein (cupin superfamily)
MEKAEKPWGGYIAFARNEKVTVKILKIAQGGETSLHSHKNRDEDWFVLSGKAGVQYGYSPKGPFQNVTLGKGGGIVIARGMVHRVKGLEDTLILEVARGQADESDIFRYEDRYGRVQKKRKFSL